MMSIPYLDTIGLDSNEAVVSVSLTADFLNKTFAKTYVCSVEAIFASLSLEDSSFLDAFALNRPCVLGLKCLKIGGSWC